MTKTTAKAIRFIQDVLLLKATPKLVPTRARISFKNQSEAYHRELTRAEVGFW